MQDVLATFYTRMTIAQGEHDIICTSYGDAIHTHPSPTPCIAVVVFFFFVNGDMKVASEREFQYLRKHALRHGGIGRKHAVGIE